MRESMRQWTPTSAPVDAPFACSDGRPHPPEALWLFPSGCSCVPVPHAARPRVRTRPADYESEKTSRNLMRQGENCCKSDEPALQRAEVDRVLRRRTYT